MRAGDVRAKHGGSTARTLCALCVVLAASVRAGDVRAKHGGSTARTLRTARPDKPCGGACLCCPHHGTCPSLLILYKMLVSISDNLIAYVYDILFWVEYKLVIH